MFPHDTKIPKMLWLDLGKSLIGPRLKGIPGVVVVGIELFFVIVEDKEHLWLSFDYIEEIAQVRQAMSAFATAK